MRGGPGRGKLAYLPKTCPSKSDHPACLTLINPRALLLTPLQHPTHPADARTRGTAPRWARGLRGLGYLGKV